MAKADPDQSSVTANPPVAPADGSSSIALVVTVLDNDGTPLSGKVVSLNANWSGKASPPVGTTDGRGIASFTCVDTKSEVVFMSAQVNSDATPINQKAQLQFI